MKAKSAPRGRWLKSVGAVVAAAAGAATLLVWEMPSIRPEPNAELEVSSKLGASPLGRTGRQIKIALPRDLATANDPSAKARGELIYVGQSPAESKLPSLGARALNGARESEDRNENRETAAQLLALHPVDRVSNVASALIVSARRSPDSAVLDAIRFCDADPSYSFEYGNALISALGAVGQYDAALRFILAEDADGGLGENGSKWLNALFTSWARDNPREAWDRIRENVPAGFQDEAFQLVAAAWIRADPAALGAFLENGAARSASPTVRNTLLARLEDSLHDGPGTVGANGSR